MPGPLAGRLAEAAVARLAEQTYEHLSRRSDHPPPVDPLLYVPSHPARDLGVDLGKARIWKATHEGKLDFHACRVAYITHLVESGADVKTVQELARHSDPRITLAIYAKARRERLAEAAGTEAPKHMASTNL
jgi:site-specific recombinase XerD